MISQAYHPGDGYNPFYRPSFRSASTAGHYDRAAPYAYPSRLDMRAEYGGRYPLRTMINEQELEAGSGGARKRIGVACLRCRRRKIKCTGDPGDGTGCQACRTSGADLAACNFIRVGSKEMSMPGGLEAFPQANYSASAHPASGYSNDSNSLPTCGQNMQLHTRPSLPTLHTRSSWMDNYDQYEDTPVDAYTYSSASMPRQDSYASSFGGVENYRSWPTTAPASAPLSAPAQSSYYGSQPSSYTFGNLQAPSYTAGQASRLPSVTADNFSPLNMGSLHSSLPIQTAQERRLPVPYTVHYPTPQPTSQIPQVRPLGPLSEPRLPTHGIHSRNAMPWSADSTAGVTRTASISAQNPAAALPALQISQPQQPYIAIPPVSEPAFGYQVSHTHQPHITGSPEISPTTLPGRSNSFSTTTSSTLQLPPATTYSYGPITSSTDYTMPTPNTSGATSSRHPMQLYSFSADERPATASSEADHDDDEGGMIGSSTTSSLSSHASTGNLQAYNNVNLANNAIDIRHPLSQRSLQGLRRREDPEQRRAATAQRMSVSNLSAGQY